jgi:hypothetical protein
MMSQRRLSGDYFSENINYLLTVQIEWNISPNRSGRNSKFLDKLVSLKKSTYLVSKNYVPKNISVTASGPTVNKHENVVK